MVKLWSVNFQRSWKVGPWGSFSHVRSEHLPPLDHNEDMGTFSPLNLFIYFLCVSRLCVVTFQWEFF
jgi:hypothetical protein